jgi:hypothetical protein
MWKQALEDKGTFLKRGVLIFVLFQLGICIAGLIVNPDFTIGNPVAKQLLGIDVNGWHMVIAILLYLPGLFVLRQTALTQWYTVVAIFGTMLPAVWLLFDNTPLGLLALPNTTADFTYHAVSAAVLAAILGYHILQANRKVAVG